MHKIYKMERNQREVQRLMKMFKSRFVIWVTVVGPIITLLLRSKLDSTDLQRSLLVLTIIPQLMSGVLLALFSK